MSPHEAFPELAVVGDEEVEELVDDDEVPEVWVEVEEFCIEIQVTVGRAASPLVGHGANAEPDDFDVELFSPVVDAGFEGGFS